MRVAVAGATGYVGGRLVPKLVEAGHQVVCLARRPDKLSNRPWRAAVEVRECDVLDAGQVRSALAGCDVAYYLIHSMGDLTDFSDTDRRGAENFARAAEANQLARIVYLGGIVHDANLSAHLASRQEVGQALAAGLNPGDRDPSRRHHWVWFGLLRDAPIPDRSPSSNGYAPLGRDPHTADRDQ